MGTTTTATTVPLFHRDLFVNNALFSIGDMYCALNALRSSVSISAAAVVFVGGSELKVLM